MRRARNVTISLVVLGMSAGCAAIAGFDDFHEGCPPGMTKQASSSGLPTCVHPSDAGDDASGGAGNDGGGAHDGSAGLPTTTGGTSGAGNAGGRAGSGGSSGHQGILGSGGDAAPAACVSSDPRFRGAAMARVVRPDGSAFLIDRTEVTFAEYDEFLRSNPRPSTDSRCTGSPVVTMACEELLRVPDGGKKIEPELPRVCVDWCDASEYCLWAGKSLCPDTTSSDPEKLADSAFYVACTLGGSSYGCDGACQAKDCNGQDADIGHADRPGAKTECIVGERGCAIADLSGNVEEWTAGEDRGTPDGDCVVRGGFFDSPAEDLKCATRKEIPRRTKSIALGFRCCVDPG